MITEHLWADWRSEYVSGVPDPRTRSLDEAVAATAGSTLFERILRADMPDSELGILGVGEVCWVVLNRFPYTSGHFMVLPQRPVPRLAELDEAEHRELWDLVRDGTVALRAGLGCEAINVGVNEGRAAGGSQSDHLHVHCVPRWTGDTNFLPITAVTRVHSFGLQPVYERLVDAWPSTSVLRRRRPVSAGQVLAGDANAGGSGSPGLDGAS